MGTKWLLKTAILCIIETLICVMKCDTEIYKCIVDLYGVHNVKPDTLARGWSVGVGGENAGSGESKCDQI